MERFIEPTAGDKPENPPEQNEPQKSVLTQDSPASAAVKESHPTSEAFMINFFRRTGILLFTAVKEFIKDECLNLAAQISYFALFSLFPLILVVVVGISFILPSDQIARERLIQQLTAGLPTTIDVASIMRESLKQISHSQPLFIAFSFLGLIWSGTGIFDSITFSLNKAWQVPGVKPRNFFESLFIRLVLFVIFIVMLISSILITLVYDAIRGYAARNGNIAFVKDNPFWDILSYLIPWFLTFSTFILIYRVVPQRKVNWLDVWPGALVATILFELVKIGFTFYIGTFTNYNLAYGSVAGVVIFIFWLYIIAVVLLFGGEVSSIWAEMRGNKKPKKLARQGKVQEAPPPTSQTPAIPPASS